MGSWAFGALRPSRVAARHAEFRLRASPSQVVASVSGCQAESPKITAVVIRCSHTPSRRARAHGSGPGKRQDAVPRQTRPGWGSSGPETRLFEAENGRSRRAHTHPRTHKPVPFRSGECRDGAGWTAAYRSVPIMDVCRNQIPVRGALAQRAACSVVGVLAGGPIIVVATLKLALRAEGV